MNGAVAGKQMKAKKGRRNHDKDTGIFAFTFSTITSIPATLGYMCTYIRHQIPGEIATMLLPSHYWPFSVCAGIVCTSS